MSSETEKAEPGRRISRRNGLPLSFFMPSILAAASSFSIEVKSTPIHAKEEIEGVIAEQSRDPDGGLVVTPAAFHTVNRDLIIAPCPAWCR